MATDPKVTVIERITGDPALARRILSGEVVVVRQGLQQAGVFDLMVEATQAGLGDALGTEKAEAIHQRGYEHIHELVSPGDIPRVTDAVYAPMKQRALEMLDKLAPALFGLGGRFFYETSPNVRFHIPYDLAAAHRKAYDAFAVTHGQGKIAPHGPHRDPWLDCPDNVINVWIAVGPVAHGNGLTVFPDSYKVKQRFRPDGEIDEREPLTRPVTFDLSPGDMVLFHSDHLHGSELNRLDLTRYVVSFRVGVEKPHFPNGHYHAYSSSAWARGPLKALATLPAQAQASYLRSLSARVIRKLSGRRPEAEPAEEHFAADASIPVADLPVGAVRAVSPEACVARLGPDSFVGLSRRCPHRGGDFANGFVTDGQVVCPWHNLPFDAATGASACSSLAPLARYPVTVEDGRVRLDLTAPVRAAPAKRRKAAAEPAPSA